LDGNNEGEQQNANVLAGRFQFHSKYWSNVSAQAKSLICGLLTVDANERLTCENALEHDWMKFQAIDENMHLEKSVKLIRKYVSKRKNRGNNDCNEDYAFIE
jgi:serine/threonine protein kinase